MNMPPDFEIHMRTIQQLEKERQRDPRAGIPLVQLYEWVLGLSEPDENPIFYAAMCGALSDVYCTLPTGNQAANLAEAIRRGQQALGILIPQNDPLLHATIESSLGNAYRSLPTGNHASNLQQAI